MKNTVLFTDDIAHSPGCFMNTAALITDPLLVRVTRRS